MPIGYPPVQIQSYPKIPNKTMKPKFRSLIAAFTPLSRSSFVVAATFCAAAHVSGADQTWTGTTSALWNVGTNWNTAVPGSSDLAIFDALSTANLATTLGADTSILGLKIIAPTGAVSIATGNILTLGASGIDMTAATQNLTITAPLSLGAMQDLNIASGRVLAVNGGITGAGGFNKKGPGNVTLANVTNPYNGGTTLTAGIVTLGSGTAASAANLGAAGTTITMEGGTITNGTGGSNGTVTLNNAFVVNSDSTINMSNRMNLGNATTTRTITGSAKLTLNLNTTVSRDDIQSDMTAYTGTIAFTGSGSVRLFILGGKVGDGFTNCTVDMAGSANLFPQTNSGGNTLHLGALTGTSATASIGGGSAGGPTYVVGAKNTDTTFAGGVRGNANITKEGSGVLTLTNNTIIDHTGLTTITGGTLKYNGIKTGAGGTSVNSGGTLAGTGTLAGITTVANGGTLAPGDAGTGNQSFASLTLSTGSILKLGVTPSTNKAVVTGTLTLASGVNVDVNGFSTDGTYDIINITGAALSGTAATAFTATNTAGGKIYSFSSTATAIQMTISASDPTNFWNVDGGGSWATAANWTKNPVIPNAPSAIAKFGPGQGGVNPSFSTSIAVNLDDNKTIGLLSFNDDAGNVITIASGSPAGSLLMDNGASPSSIVVVTGDHYINAPIVMNSLGTGVDVGSPHSLTINGVVSGSGAALSKSGSGKLLLRGNNTYDGGTILSGGVLNVTSAANLGNITGALRFSGGTLQLAATITGDSHNIQVAGTNNAIFDTDSFDYGTTGVISPFSGGTGGVVKNSAGVLTLGGINTYTGATTVNAGTLDLTSGGSIAGGAANVNGGILSVGGGSLTSSAASSVVSSQFAMSSGSAAFNAGLNANTGNPSTSAFINLTGGTFTASAVSMGRCSPTINTPTAGSTTSGLYVNGATASIAGTLSVGLNSTGTNSTASTRIDSGSLTVNGAVLIAIASPDRWSVIDVNGGAFTSTNVATGVQIGSGQTGSDAFLVRNGTATVERFLLQQPAASTETSLLNVSGGTLYIGAGGIVGNNNAGVGILDVQLGTAILGAKASWTTLLGATLSGTTTIQAADAVAAPFDISIAGVVGGVGGFNKTGTGALTLGGVNTFTGAVNVNAGTLNITGNSSAATGAVTVASAATLGGNGNIGGNVTIQTGGRHALAVAATVGAQVTRTIAGTLDLQAGNFLDLTSAGPVAGGVYTLATATGGITGSLGTFTLSGGLTGTPSVSGNSLILTVSGSAYASWASSFGLQDPWLGVNPALNGTPAADPDNDGIANQLEFALGGNPTLSSTNILPSLTVTTTNFIFTFSRIDESEAEVALTFQSGTTLAPGSWANLAIGADTATSGAGVVVLENGASADSVTVTIPKGANTALFGRLQSVK